MRSDYIIIFFIVLISIGAYNWMNRPPAYDYGAVVMMSPVQEMVFNKHPFQFREYTIAPQARFKVEGLVLGVQHHFFSQDSKLVPVDLLLGWGPMSDADVLKDINLHQSGRWFSYSYQHSPIPEGEIVSHVANMHLIAASPSIQKKIDKVKKGDIVDFKGYLVNVTKEDGWHWNSSLSRTDTGDGSCELVWVEEFGIENE